MSVTQTYFICATMRSGSSLLCNMLQKTNCAGNPKEFLRDHLSSNSILSDEAYMNFIHQQLVTNVSTNGVTGVKLMKWNFDALLKRIRPVGQVMSDTELLEKVFPNAKFILITRRDKLAQSISLCRAEKTRMWKKDVSEKKQKAFPFPRITDFHISRNLSLIEEWEKSWHDFFDANSIPAYTVVYEDMVSDYEACLSKVLNFLEVLPEDTRSLAVVPDLKKQADFYSRFLSTRYKLFIAINNILPESILDLLASLKLSLRQILLGN